MKSQLIRTGVLVLLSLFLVLGCTTDFNKRKEKQLAISEIKSKDGKKYIGKSITLRGFFVDRPAPMLVSSMHYLNINAPIPESEYIRLTGKGIQGLPPKKFYGAYVNLDGIVTLSTDKETKIMREKIGDIYAFEFTCPTPPIILVEPKVFIIPEYIDLCEINPKFCLTPPVLFSHKYALLLSGGINSWNAHSRYWNDLKLMYNTLRTQYGFSDANIVVVYKDGTAEDTDMTVDYAADSTGVQSAFNYLQNRLTRRDLFVFFATNHGGGFLMEEVNARNRGGRVDTSGDETDEAIFEEHLGTDLNADGDTSDQVRYDEVTYLYNSTQDLWDDDLASYLDNLRYEKMIIILEPCFSGGNLADLRGKNRIIISACSAYEYSYGGAPGNHDMFSYHFTVALAGQDHNGNAVNADSNNDGKVSILEAFEYARSNDTAGETPWYEDSGDGRGHTGPFPQDGDGSFGANVTLD